jgi:hypothetical protein
MVFTFFIFYFFFSFLLPAPYRVRVGFVGKVTLVFLLHLHYSSDVYVLLCDVVIPTDIVN